MICKICGYDVTFIEKESGPHIGQYCPECEAWQKWRPKSKKPRRIDNHTFGEFSKLNGPVQDKLCDTSTTDDAPWNIETEIKK